MTPRPDIVGARADATLAELRQVFAEQQYSRVPVYRDSLDHILGFVFVKDLIRLPLDLAAEDSVVERLLRPAHFVPETKRVSDLLKEFQRQQVQSAVVVDEYGGTAGLVTIEDLLEEIVGEIQDEYDVEEPMIERLSDDEARVDGRANVDDLADLFGTDVPLEDEDEYDTVGGLIYHRIGGVPRPGDQVSLDGLTLTVEKTDGRRVSKVLVVRNREAPGPADDEADR
jgi:CBS domain containing-hemolysin-like protein